MPVPCSAASVLAPCSVHACLPCFTAPTPECSDYGQAICWPGLNGAGLHSRCTGLLASLMLHGVRCAAGTCATASLARARRTSFRTCLPQVTAVYRSGSDEDVAAEDASSAGAAGAAGATSEEVSGLSDVDFEALDAASLRRLLLGLGLPASGKISKLRERLREARDA